MNTTVTNLVMLDTAGVKTVDQIVFERSGESGKIAVRPVDRGFVTLGSMTEGSSLGSMDEAPLAKGKAAGGAWTLWETIAAGRAEFGSPGVFSNHADQSKWVSFTTTMRDPTLLRIVRDLTGNVPGEGGLILLRHKFSRRERLAIGAAQQGHRESVSTSATTNRLRIVAMEFGT